MESSICYLSKIFQKTNISYPLTSTRTYAYGDKKCLFFRKLLGAYYIYDPYSDLNYKKVLDDMQKR